MLKRLGQYTNVIIFRYYRNRFDHFDVFSNTLDNHIAQCKSAGNMQRHRFLFAIILYVFDYMLFLHRDAIVQSKIFKSCMNIINV